MSVLVASHPAGRDLIKNVLVKQLDSVTLPESLFLFIPGTVPATYQRHDSTQTHVGGISGSIKVTYRIEPAVLLKSPMLAWVMTSPKLHR